MLGKALTDLISTDQCAFVKGRNIFDAIRTLSDIVDYSKLHSLPGLMVTIDFEKAVDSFNEEGNLEILFFFRTGKSENFEKVPTMHNRHDCVQSQK